MKYSGSGTMVPTIFVVKQRTGKNSFVDLFNFFNVSNYCCYLENLFYPG